MKAATIPADVRAMLIGAGLSNSQIDRWLEAEDLRKPTTGATPEQALRALRLADAPPSLVRAYLEAGASPRRVVRDLVMHYDRGRLPAAAVALLTARLKTETACPAAFAAQVWRDIRAKARAQPQTGTKPKQYPQNTALNARR